MVNVFNVQVFFVVFRESLEAVVVVSVLLAFLKQGLGNATEDPLVYKKLRKQVWLGAGVGLGLCLVMGCAFIAVFYTLKSDIWGQSEDIWEGVFCMIAAIMITFMSLAMLRINKMKEKWRVKLAQALLKPSKGTKTKFNLGHFTRKYAMFILPFITTLREGLEAVVFVGGVGLNSEASSFPLPVICGLIAGILVGVVLFYSGTNFSLQMFLIVSTCFLYLVAAGLFSRSIWYFETYVFNRATGGDATENGSGPGTYNIEKSVWHVNCCHPSLDNGWNIFNALFGWQNSATYGSVISYNMYWLAIIVTVLSIRYEEKHGHLPFCKNATWSSLNPLKIIKSRRETHLSQPEREALFEKVRAHKIAGEDHSCESICQKHETSSAKQH